MSEKVKVSHEIANALDTLLENNSKDHVLYLIADKGPHSIGRFDAEAIIFLRKNTSPLGVAKMLINGYEVELTPEEVISKDFLIEKENALSNPYADSRIRSHGYTLGVRNTLELLGIKIKGINKQ